MKVWLLRIDYLNGSGCQDSDGHWCSNHYHDTAFLDRCAASVWAEQKKQEYMGYTPQPHDAGKVTIENGKGEDMVVVGRSVFCLDKSSGNSAVKKRALAKLTAEEIAALGLGNCEKKQVIKCSYCGIESKGLVMNGPYKFCSIACMYDCIERGKDG